jgi:hypothetical protein
MYIRVRTLDLGTRFLAHIRPNPFFLAHSRFLVVSLIIFITPQQQQHINNNNSMANFRPNPYKNNKSPPAPPPPSTGPVKNPYSKLAASIFVSNKKQCQFANESPAANACPTVINNLDNGVIEKLQSVVISIFEVFAGGLLCSSCDKHISVSPGIGLGDEKTSASNSSIACRPTSAVSFQVFLMHEVVQPLVQFQQACSKIRGSLHRILAHRNAVRPVAVWTIRQTSTSF